MKTSFTTIFVLILLNCSFAQDTVNTLLTIDNKPVTKDEFLRIYNKNSSIADDQKKSVDEYLDLFINYKLKVIEAVNLGYDTMSTFVKEMEGYTKQLAKPYLENNNAIDSFAREAYQRSLEEINASHILLRVDKHAIPKDTVIKDNSPDPENEIGGDLGWFSTFRMVYAFESGAYNTPVGQISLPVRTEFGYHLIKVNGRRPNRGDVNASHILAYIPRNPSDVEVAAAEQKIQKAYDELQAGVPWGDVVKKYSEHTATVGNEGNLGWLRAGSGPDELLDMCFSLDTGTYSKPFKSQYGYHIVKTLGFKPVQTYSEVEADYKKKVKQTGAIQEITREQVLQRIKTESGYKFYEANLDPLYAISDSTMRTGKWDPERAKDLKEPIFIIGDKTYTQYDIAKAVCSKRIGNPSLTLPMSIRKRLMTYIDDELFNFEMEQLPNKYPDYKYLLEEYHDGILLFNLTEDMVWKKAIDDSTGLQNFYDSLPEKYTWETRLALTKYVYRDSSLTAGLLKLAKKRVKSGTTADGLSKSLCPQDTIPCVSFTELKYERGDNSVADSMKWTKGTFLTSKDKENNILYYVDDVLPEQMKTLKDARGLYTADYQAYLEKEWVQELRKKYTIQVNAAVLNQIRMEEQPQSK
jgi:peptidyl-prolyl cis-trans isomerase SurA